MKVGYRKQAQHDGVYARVKLILQPTPGTLNCRDWSKLLKSCYVGDHRGSVVGAMKADTRSLAYVSCRGYIEKFRWVIRGAHFLLLQSYGLVFRVGCGVWCLGLATQLLISLVAFWQFRLCPRPLSRRRFHGCKQHVGFLTSSLLLPGMIL